MLKNIKRVGNHIASISILLPEWISNGLVTLLSAFLILMSPMAVHGLDGPGRWKNYSWMGIVIVLVMVLLLARYMTEDNTPKKVRWSILIPALLFVGSMFVSECIVPKVRPVYQGVSKCYLAYILMGAFLGYSDRVQEKFWNCFMNGVGVSFAISTLFCFVHRPVYEDYGYLGMYPNQNPFGIYLVLVVAASIWSLHQVLYKGRKKHVMPFWVVSLILALFLVVKSGSRAALLNSIGLLMVWILVVMLDEINRKYRWKKLVCLASLYGMLLVFFLLSYSFLSGMLNTVPLIIKHPITSELDPQYYSEYYSGDVETSERYEKSQNQVLEKGDLSIVKSDLVTGSSDEDYSDVPALKRLIDTLTRGSFDQILGDRSWIYKYGLTHMSVWGHENAIFTDAEGRGQSHMHNGPIQYGYVYGYVCAIGYLLLGAMQLITKIQEGKNVSSSYLACLLILVTYMLVYIFEAGGTVVRDVMMVPYLLATGQMMWKVSCIRK